jgi:hypothetical protein
MRWCARWFTERKKRKGEKRWRHEGRKEGRLGFWWSLEGD